MDRGGGNCAVDTEVSKEVDIGWNETRVAPGKAVVCHSKLNVNKL